MAIVPMEDAVANTAASSEEYNKLIDNIEDLDARLGPVVSASTADARLDTLEATTTHATTGNVALGVTTADHESRITTLEGSSSGGGAIAARGTRATSSTATTTIKAALRLDDVPVVVGRAYEVGYTCVTSATVGTDNIRTEIRYTTDGSTPTETSPVLPGTQMYAAQNNRNITTVYAPPANQTLSLLLCVARFSGTGSVSLFAETNRPIEMFIKDAGLDTGDDGVDIV